MVSFDDLFKQRKKQKQDLSREERRSKALSEGASILFFKCPMCGMNRPLHRTKKSDGTLTRLSFGKDGWENDYILQTRRGGGKGSGFFLDPEGSLNLKEVRESGEYDDVLKQIKEQCKKILEELE